MLERLQDYRHKLRLIRQIMSNKANRYHKINTSVNVTTVVVSSFLAFMGFSGLPKIQEYISTIAVVELSAIEFLFNLLIFGIFILVVLHLVFRFGAKQSEAERAIVLLTHLANQVDDILVKGESGSVIRPQEVDLLRGKYDMVIQVIPSNSDREYKKARRDYREKEEHKVASPLSARELFDQSAQVRTVRYLVRESPAVMKILHTLRQVDERLFLGGGLVRNLVWDYLHGYTSATPIDDVDVIYFDPLGATKEHDKAIEEKLRKMLPNLKWSVKNQARMHESNGDTPYESVEDAVAKWPETATALLACLNDDGEVQLIAPHGYGDLFRLIVAPTAHFGRKIDTYRDRVSRKNWGEHWPSLRFIGLEPTIKSAGSVQSPRLDPPADEVSR